MRDPLSGRATSEAGAEVYVADMDDDASLRRLRQGLDGVALDILLCNAGLYGQNQDFGAVDADAFLRVMRVNVLAPLRMAELFAEQVRGGGIIAAISSKMGSVAENSSGGVYAYRASKAALNMVLKSLSLDLRGRGVIVLALSPGWVRTDMGGAGAPLSPSEAVAGMRTVLERAAPADSGRFWHYDGSEIGW